MSTNSANIIGIRQKMRERSTSVTFHGQDVDWLAGLIESACEQAEEAERHGYVSEDSSWIMFLNRTIRKLELRGYSFDLEVAQN